jgi:hypothetical protein
VLTCQISTQMTAEEIARAVYRTLCTAGCEDQAQVFTLTAHRTRDLADTVQAALRAAPELRIEWTEAPS